MELGLSQEQLGYKAKLDRTYNQWCRARGEESDRRELTANRRGARHGTERHPWSGRNNAGLTIGLRLGPFRRAAGPISLLGG